MRKYIIKFIILIISFGFVSVKTHSFLGEDLGLNLYKNIDEGFEELVLKNYEYELQGGRNSSQEYINEILEYESGDNNSCYKLSGDLSPEEILEIVEGGNIRYEKIHNECGSNDSIPISHINNINRIILNIFRNARYVGENKSKQIYKISKIGIYSDGILENSGFDLIDDLKEIDKIIFSETIEYNGNENYEISDDDYFNKLFEDTSNLIILDNDKKTESNITQKVTLDSNTNSTIYLSTNDLCLDDSIVNSGLSEESINGILGVENIVTINNNGNEFENDIISELNNSSYEKVNDNELWSCSDFFCINIEFIMYNQSLLGSWETISIESLLARSNDHLKKFASTSLVQSKMGTNNFELSLKDLDLPSAFHIGVQVSSKPVPILSELPNFKQEDKNDNNEDNNRFSAENMLKEYYKSLSLDYNRSNDLDIYKKSDFNLKTIIESTGMSIQYLSKKSLELDEELRRQELMGEHMENAISKKNSYSEMDDFYDQFNELEGFIGSILDYANSLNAIIKGMSEIPIDES